MKTLYIAEKPDIAASMAAYLWPKDYQKLKDKHCYRKGDTTVTWAYGHILMQSMPEAYGEQFKQFSNYPIIPSEWKKEPSPSCKEQFTAIRKMLKDTDIVVNGGDPDREGQLLIDEILEYVGYRGKVERILINAKDDASMARAFSTIRKNDDFKNLYHAGLARERADWLVGMNLSRCYSVNAGKCGIGGVWRIGRVKMATLALVVQREREIQNFRPVDFFTLRGEYSMGGVKFSAMYVPKDDAPTDSDGRILDSIYLARILHEIEGKECKVIAVEKKSGTENAPLPYSLDTLQLEANKRYGMSPKSVLDTVQSLYEKKYVSYPRSDCNYIPTSQHADAGRILAGLRDYGIEGMSIADITIQSKAFDDRKISAHHAIIPTGLPPNSLSEWEAKIYDLIAKRYLVQFCKPCMFDTVKFQIETQGHLFAGSGKVITSLGWKEVIQGEKDDDLTTDNRWNSESRVELAPTMPSRDRGRPEVNLASTISLPPISVGDILMPPTYAIDTKQTQPPKRFTEGTLLAAMTNIWRFVSPNNPNRERLKDCKGIGTPATRDTIITELMADKSGKTSISPCIAKTKSGLQPTAFGCCLIDNVDETLTKPDFTATMEYKLTEIAEGRLSLRSFEYEIINLVNKNIDFAEHTTFKNTAGINADNQEQPDSAPPEECPICHKKTLERKYSPKTKTYFWVCSDKECVHPVTKKVQYYADERKKPQINHCPTCKTVTTRVFSKKTNKYYWFCPKCESFINDDNNSKDNKRQYNK